MMEKNSLMYWYPKIKDLGIPTPKTEIVEMPGAYLKIHPEVGMDALKPYEDAIFAAAKKVGYPLFLRNDQTACKHYWTETCYVKSEDVLMKHICRLTEETSCLGFIGLPWEALVFREFVPLESYFVSFAKDFPVSKEYRYFIHGRGIQCKHPYWFDEVIETEYHKTTPPNDWKEILAKLNTLTPEDEEVLDQFARTVSIAMGGYWSVDFAKAKNGTWYLTDMALGKESFHYPKCEFAKAMPEQKQATIQFKNEPPRE